MSELPEILDCIRERPADSLRWLTLARWLDDQGRDHEGAQVRAFYPLIRDRVNAELPLDQALALVAPKASCPG
jgi:uncharacterized protein (TIGR02996 family)